VDKDVQQICDLRDAFRKEWPIERLRRMSPSQ
jgi:hypothetical protein